MDKFALLSKTVNFQIKTALTRLRGIKVIGNPLKSRCTMIGSFKCSKNSHIIIGSINASKNFYISSVDGATIEIGNGVFLNRNCTIVAKKRIKIGDNCSFGPNVCIFDHDHTFGQAKKNGENFKISDVIIGNDCWIGANTVVLRGTQVGDNCVIGAGCVLQGKIPDNSLVVADRKLQIKKLNNNNETL